MTDFTTGVTVGVVESFDDPAGEGRIQVSFPLLDQCISGWASVAAPLAGGGRGAFFMPEPRDEVLVAFQHGDFDHPFIVGHLWNGVDKPPEAERRNRVIVTPGGHTLRFEDGDQKRIVLRSNGQHEVLIDDTDGKIVVSVHNGATVTLKAAEITLVGGGRSIEMKNGKVNIT
jgi:uncharacterized protein involved in type VI secretion and phage assembly